MRWFSAGELELAIMEEPVRCADPKVHRECLLVTNRQQLTTNQMYEFTVDPGLFLLVIL